MLFDRRFASLRGQSRQLIEELGELEELEEELDEEPDPLDSVVGELPAERWQELRDQYERLLRLHASARGAP